MAGKTVAFTTTASGAVSWAEAKAGELAHEKEKHEAARKGRGECKGVQEAQGRRDKHLAAISYIPPSAPPSHFPLFLPSPGLKMEVPQWSGKWVVSLDVPSFLPPLPQA